MGGECNYLLRVTGADKRLAFVPDAEWKSAEMQGWKEPEIQLLLTRAQAALLEAASRLRLDVKVPAAVPCWATQVPLVNLWETPSHRAHGLQSYAMVLSGSRVVM
jgi:IMP-specific 5'-nucleotidase